MFIDYLGLDKKNLKKTQLIVFFGVSGGGKSTYLHYLMKKNKDNLFLFHKEKPIAYQQTESEWVFIDEIVYISQFYTVFRYLFAGKKVFVATHLPLFIYNIFFVFTSKLLFSTEKNREKISAYLINKDITSDDETLKLFMKEYKGSFTILDDMLKNYPNDKDFSTIFHSFSNDCTVTIRNNY